jgi:UDP:flavonoid glycosyltransferase YjiC (YdhE family)
MRVLAACSLGGAGHLGPLLPFLGAARRRGDETLVIGPPAMAAMVGDTGFTFVAGGEPAEDVIAPIRERLPVVSRQEASILGNRELFGRLAATAMLPAMERTCARWGPDLVLRDPCEYASAVVAPRLGVPTAQVAISLAEVEAGSIRAATPALDEHGPDVARDLWAAPYLTRFPASLDPSPFPATVRFRGPTAAGKPLPDWWEGSDAPFVYLTFGTVLGHMTYAADVYRTALRAVGVLDARVLLTVGHKFDLADLGPVPPNVHVEPWIDQADVLGQADVVVCHGGSGTVFGALAAGVPLVVVPLFADQSENAQRTTAAGAGRTVDADAATIGPDDAPRIAEAIDTVLATPSYRARAERIAAEMATTPSPEAVLDELFSR